MFLMLRVFLFSVIKDLEPNMVLNGKVIISFMHVGLIK
jgi:hypothetical protein